MKDLKELEREIPYQWRVQSFSKNKASCSCVSYIDARDVMDLLDDVCGKENWQDSYEFKDGKLVAGIGVRIKSEPTLATPDSWVWKYDTGTEGDMEKEKSQFSDAFKRAAVKWGVGRFLYSLGIEYLDANEVKTSSNYPYPIDKNGKRIWDLTTYINNLKLKK